MFFKRFSFVYMKNNVVILYNILVFNVLSVLILMG